MTFTRKLPILVAVLATVGVVMVLLVFAAPVQTWAVRRVLAEQTGLKASVARVDLGLRHATVERLQVTYAGAVLTLPRLEANLPLLSAALRDRVDISRLVARGWTLDLTRYDGTLAVAQRAVAPPAAPFSLVSTAYAANALPAAQAVFQGVFAQLNLPVDLTMDGVSLAGEVLLPAAHGKTPVRVQVTLVGGGLGAGQEGVFNLSTRLEADAGAPNVRILEVRGDLAAVMDTPRTFSRVAMKLDSLARGPAFPEGVQLTADGSAERVPGGESYALTVQTVGKRLLDLQANYPENSSRLGGVWRLDVRDIDVAPFVLGRPLPVFEAVGSGMFETDTGFAEIHTAGRIKSTASRLETIRPELAAVGALTVFSEFNLTQIGSSIRVDGITFDIGRPEPVLSLNSLQPFEFNVSTGELKVAEPGSDLLALDMQNLPLAWSRTFLPDWTLSGGVLRGRLIALARNGGLMLRAQEPLTADGIALAHAGEPWLREVDALMNLTAVYSPLGWQAEVPLLRFSSGGRELLNLALKAGQLPGEDTPLKATGQLVLLLPSLLAQPVAADLAGLQDGRLQLDFVASLGAVQELQARTQLTRLVGPDAVRLSDVTGEARATIDAAGEVRFQLPLQFFSEEKSRTSDLALNGKLQPTAAGWSVDGRLTGRQVFLEDVQLLGAALGTADPADAAAESQTQPFWAGLEGAIAIAVEAMHYRELFELREVTGTIRIEAGELRVDGVQAGVGSGGSARAAVGVTHRADVALPYALAAELAVTAFDPGPLFTALDPQRPAQVEGSFDLRSRLQANGGSPADLLNRAQGDVTLTSTGGIFRLLSPELSGRIDTAGKAASIGALLGNVAQAFGKGKSAAEFAGNAQAVAEVARMLSAIRYDQLNVDLVRDDALNTALRNFTLIAPEIRLEGNGRLTDTGTGDFLQQALAMEFNLKARGHTGDALRFLHLVAPQADELGYLDCTLPLRISGTLASPDTGELRSALTNLALEKSGATDLLNRLLGK